MRETTQYVYEEDTALYRQQVRGPLYPQIVIFTLSSKNSYLHKTLICSLKADKIGTLNYASTKNALHIAVTATCGSHATLDRSKITPIDLRVLSRLRSKISLRGVTCSARM